PLKKEEKNRKKVTYLVSFEPSENVFNDGTNPLLLIDELHVIGKAKVYNFIRNADFEQDYQPKKNYTTWRIFLVCELNENPIRDVFIFVEDTSKLSIHKVFDGDLLAIAAFNEALPEKNLGSKPFEIEAVDKILSGISSELAQAIAEEASAPVDDEEGTYEEESTEEETEAEVKPIRHAEEAITSIRVSSDKLDELMNQVSELVTTQAGLSLYAENNFDPALNVIADNVEKLSRQLRDIAFQMTLIPISNLFRKFNRVTRDISAQLGKSVKFITDGG
ncbi:MAG: hypothetical protein AAFY41_19615, partial [Bacteroidota bacterium]